MQLKTKVLSELLDAADFISGEEIATRLGVTRASVWKAIRALSDEGVQIEATKKSGYRLRGNRQALLARLLTPESIEAYLDKNRDWSLDRIEVHQLIDSTNLEARRLAAANSDSPKPVTSDFLSKKASGFQEKSSIETEIHSKNNQGSTDFVENDEENQLNNKVCSRDALIVALEQTSGRGRLGRKFFSPYGCGVYVSLLLHPNSDASDATLITTAAAVAAAETIDKFLKILRRNTNTDEKISKNQAKIKWVNDIYLREKKVCGILTEAQVNLETGKLEYAVLGMGFNIFEPEQGFPAEAGNAGAIFPSSEQVRTLPNDIFSRFTAELVNKFYSHYHQTADQSQKNLDPTEFIDKYRERSFLQGKRVWVRPIASDDAQAYAAIVEAIDDDFRLVVRTDDGEQKCLSTGEVTLKL